MAWWLVGITIPRLVLLQVGKIFNSTQIYSAWYPMDPLCIPLIIWGASSSSWNYAIVGLQWTSREKGWWLLGGKLATNRVGGWTNPGDFNGIFVGAISPQKYLGWTNPLTIRGMNHQVGVPLDMFGHLQTWGEVIWFGADEVGRPPVSRHLSNLRFLVLALKKQPMDGATELLKVYFGCMIFTKNKRLILRWDHIFYLIGKLYV